MFSLSILREKSKFSEKGVFKNRVVKTEGVKTGVVKTEVVKTGVVKTEVLKTV